MFIKDGVANYTLYWKLENNRDGWKKQGMLDANTFWLDDPSAPRLSSGASTLFAGLASTAALAYATLI